MVSCLIVVVTFEPQFAICICMSTVITARFHSWMNRFCVMKRVFIHSCISFWNLLFIPKSSFVLIKFKFSYYGSFDSFHGHDGKWSIWFYLVLVWVVFAWSSWQGCLGFPGGFLFSLPCAPPDNSFSSLSDLLWKWDLLTIRKSQNITGCFQATLCSVGFSWIKRFEEHVKKTCLVWVWLLQ